MTLKGGASQACAACKYQRRKCIPDCPLAPYFPADQPKMFQNAHKLFGVSNILKILKSVDPSQKNEAMHSIKCQAYFRDKYPVHGCVWVIKQLQYQIQLLEEEHHAVHAQLEMYRQHHLSTPVSSLPLDEVPSQLELGMAPPCNAALSLFNPSLQQSYDDHVAGALPITQQQQHQQQHSYSHINSISYGSSYIDSKDNVTNSLWLQDPDNNATNNNSNNSIQMAIQSQMATAQPLAVQQEVLHDYDEIHPFFDPIDDRQSDDSKEAYDPSSEELKDTTQSMEHVAENELKSAAACFTLTSVN
ncbi:hypothetical protein SLA2020_201480 [Shorea laevis]